MIILLSDQGWVGEDHAPVSLTGSTSCRMHAYAYCVYEYYLASYCYNEVQPST